MPKRVWPLGYRPFTGAVALWWLVCGQIDAVQVAVLRLRTGFGLSIAGTIFEVPARRAVDETLGGRPGERRLAAARPQPSGIASVWEISYRRALRASFEAGNPAR
jgi:hypothetical protein